MGRAWGTCTMFFTDSVSPRRSSDNKREFRFRKRYSLNGKARLIRIWQGYKIFYDTDSGPPYVGTATIYGFSLANKRGICA